MDILTPATVWSLDTTPEEAPLPRLSLAKRIAVLIGVVGPFIGLIVSIILLWGRGIGAVDLGMMILLYSATVFGVTVGFHRLLTHRSFQTVGWIRDFLAICGSMSLQGPVIKWCAVHRRHHQVADRHGDPHSPNLHDGTILSRLTSFWHAHVGWIFKHDPHSIGRSAQDLLDTPSLVFIDRYFFFWVFLGVFIPAVVGGLASQSWGGFFTGFLWGGLVRLFLMHHVTWSINSVCHIWGTRPYRSSDQSANNIVCALVSFGEGWHNNHHAFPTSVRHGLKWWQLDMSYIFIRGLNLVGLAWDLRIPTTEVLHGKMIAKAA